MAIMKAIRAHRFGGPDVLRLEDVPRPEPGEGQVLVRVRATSVNPVDWKVREGRYREVPLPFTPGGDFSGVVELLGPGATGFAEGDEVYGCMPSSLGAAAEFLVAPIEAMARKPHLLDGTQAASVPLAALTAWQALFDHGRLAAGESVLVLGASGGVGWFTAQLAKQAGARVLGTSSRRNIERVHRAGVDRVIDYGAERIEDVAKDVDLGVDLVGGELGKRGLSCVRRGGRLVSTVEPPLVDTANARGIETKYFRVRPSAAQLGEIAKRIDAGALKVEVARVLPLARAGEAEELNRRHEVAGKIVLKVAA
jgi:NADPH:quinone reductase-like Zn-dependent oxidoreductase